MRVTCMQDRLASGINVVRRAVAKNSPYPILSNIYVGAENGALQLAATDREVGITVRVEASIEREGATTLPSKLFNDLVKQSPPERISLELKSTTQELKYRCGSIDSTMKGIDPEEFPILASSEDGETINLPTALLKEMIEQVAFCAAKDDSRPILTGVLMDFKENQLVMAAADGFRLSVRSCNFEQIMTDVRVVVPARALKELGSIIDLSMENVSITITESLNQILFKMGNVELSSQLIDGSFPDVQRLVPASHTTRTVVDTIPLLRAVKRADLFAREAAHIIRLSLSGGSESGAPGVLTLTAESSELGGNTEELIASIEGDDMEIAFNAEYVIEALGIMKTDQVALEMTSSGAPGLFRPLGDSDFTHVIMPMHIPAR